MKYNINPIRSNVYTNRYRIKRGTDFFAVKYKNSKWIPGRKTISFIYIFSMAVVLYITGFELKLINTELLVNEIKQYGIDYDAFRSFPITGEMIHTAGKSIIRLRKHNPGLDNKIYIDTIGYLTFCMMASDYDQENYKTIDDTTFLRGIAKVAGTQSFQELYEYYRAVLTDLKYFPVPKVESNIDDITYTDTWYVFRSYGGNRRHEGTDLMDPNNIRGFFPVVSMTDGVVEKMGWLEQGGYRIGIRCESGGYFYYAHLNSYAPELKEGDKVIAGQLLGFMGDSGYGPEGTVGQFEVHLHVGIYIQSKIGDISVNPYWVLKMLENNRTTYKYD
jgi:hypothetical protein